MFSCITPSKVVIYGDHHSADALTQAVIAAVQIHAQLDCFLAKINFSSTLRIRAVLNDLQRIGYFAHLPASISAISLSSHQTAATGYATIRRPV
jgi:hypothetical protein